MRGVEQPRRYPLILNPRARSERAQRALRFVMENATRFAIYASKSPEEAGELADRFAREGQPVVVAAGGTERSTRWSRGWWEPERFSVSCQPGP